MDGNFRVLGCRSLAVTAKVWRASGPCTLQAGLTAAGKGLSSANLTHTKKLLALVWVFFSIV